MVVIHEGAPGALQAVLWYARRLGWRLLPLTWAKDELCSCGRPDCHSPAKHPRIRRGVKNASSDPGQLRRWWAKWPMANVGLACGRASGVLALDVDGAAGEEALEQLAEELGAELPPTIEQRTAKGRHLLYRMPDVDIRNKVRLAPDLDVRSTGGYIVIAPSVHASGAAYRWVDGHRPNELEAAELPSAWVERLKAPTKPKRERTNKLISNPGGSTAWGQRRLEANCDDVTKAPDGARNDALNTAAYKVGQGVAAGEIDEEAAREALSEAAAQAGLGEGEARKTIESGLKSGQNDPRGPKPTKPKADSPKRRPSEAQEESVELGERDESWRDALLLTKGGRLTVTLSNALLLCRNLPELKGRLAYDERGVIPWWLTAPPWEPEGAPPRQMKDADAVEAAAWLAAKTGTGFGKSVLEDALLTEAHRHPFDRVREYLEGLRWDERPRLDRWLIDYFEAKREDARGETYLEAVGPAWCISAVARAFDPGSKVDHMLVFEGRQGSLKSSSLAALGGRFYQELVVEVGSRDSLLAVHGPWIIEWGELAGLTRREAESVKSFLSRTQDRFRPPYGRLAADFPRRCVFAGTTNDTSYLNDATGNRRYWPIEITRGNPEALERDRDQLWAEAVYRYRCGERWWLEGELERLAADYQENRLEGDVWESTIELALDRGRLQGRDFVTSSDLVAELGLPVTAQNPGTGRRLARIMRRLGWAEGRVRLEDGSRPRGYSKVSK